MFNSIAKDPRFDEAWQRMKNPGLQVSHGLQL